MFLKHIGTTLPTFPFHVFLIEIDPIPKVFKNVSDGSSSFFGACLFQNCQNMDFQKSEIHTNNMFKNGSRFFLICFGVLVSPKIKQLVLGFGDGFKNPGIGFMVLVLWFYGFIVYGCSGFAVLWFWGSRFYCIMVLWS